MPGWRPAASSSAAGVRAGTRRTRARAAALTVPCPKSAAAAFAEFIGKYELAGAFRGRGLQDRQKAHRIESGLRRDGPPGIDTGHMEYGREQVRRVHQRLRRASPAVHGGPRDDQRDPHPALVEGILGGSPGERRADDPRGAAVVAHEDDVGFRQLALADPLQQTAYFGVHGVDHRPVVFAGVPARRIIGKALEFVGQQFLRRLVKRGMGRGHRQPQEPRLPLSRFQPAKGVIDEFGRRVPVDQFCPAVHHLSPGEVVAQAAPHETRIVRHAHPGRVVVSAVTLIGQMPFADDRAVIGLAGVRLEEFEERRLAQADARVRSAGRPPDAGAETVAPGQDRRPRRRTGGLRPEILEHHPAPAQRIDIRRRGRVPSDPVASQCLDAHVIGDDQQDVVPGMDGGAEGNRAQNGAGKKNALHEIRSRKWFRVVAGHNAGSREVRCSNSSMVRGQSFLSSRDRERSARSLPPVWQRGQ